MYLAWGALREKEHLSGDPAYAVGVEMPPPTLLVTQQPKRVSQQDGINLRLPSTLGLVEVRQAPAVLHDGVEQSLRRLPQGALRHQAHVSAHLEGPGVTQRGRQLLCRGLHARLEFAAGQQQLGLGRRLGLGLRAVVLRWPQQPLNLLHARSGGLDLVVVHRARSEAELVRA